MQLFAKEVARSETVCDCESKLVTVRLNLQGLQRIA